MRKMIVLAVLAMVLTANVGNALALDAKKFGPTTIYDPAPIPLPNGGTDSILPSII